MADWSFWTPANLVEPDGVLIKGERKRLIDGIAATETEDQHGEEIVLDGMDFDPYLDSGHLNDDHMPGEQHILGKPLEAKIVKDASKIRKGLSGPAFYHLCELFDTEPGRAAWDNMRAERKDPKRQRGFSVEGAVLAALGKSLTKTLVEDVALTRRPANTDTFAQMVKSLAAGNAPALVMQNLDEGESDANPIALDLDAMLWGECSHGCYDKKRRFVKGAQSALFHLVKCHGMEVESAAKFIKSLKSSGIL